MPEHVFVLNVTTKHILQPGDTADNDYDLL